MSRRLQIGVIGSMADLVYSNALMRKAEEIGYWIAQQGAVLIFGAEKDSDSLSTAACRGAKKAGGLTIGVTYGKGLRVFEPSVDVVIATGLERGGGRELSLILSCDVVIAVGGGSGTLNEITIAYQANIPVIVLAQSGGWSDELDGKFLDTRERIRIESASTPKAVVAKAISLTRRTLWVAGVHGNETIGITALEQLQRENVLMANDWMIGNPEAVRQGKRFIQSDLNRAFPGNVASETYEDRRAAEIIQQAKRYPSVVDIHGTDDDTGVFIIVSRPTAENVALAERFDVENVVLWPSVSGRVTGPLNQCVERGVEVECGPQDQEVVQEELLRVLKVYCTGTQSKTLKRYFEVYGKFVDDGTTIALKSFREATVNGEQFYPLLVDRYPGIKCYKMKRVEKSSSEESWRS